MNLLQESLKVAGGLEEVFVVLLLDDTLPFAKHKSTKTCSISTKSISRFIFVYYLCSRIYNLLHYDKEFDC